MKEKKVSVACFSDRVEEVKQVERSNELIKTTRIRTLNVLFVFEIY
jgi:hypothetical protein